MRTATAPTPAPATAELVAGAGVLALGVAALLPVGHIEDGPILCPFRRLTGLPCPGCGMTRSWTYLAHGWWEHAFTANPFGPVAVVFVLGLAAVVVRRRVRKLPPPDFERVMTHPLAVAVWGSWIAFGLVRAVLAAIS